MPQILHAKCSRKHCGVLGRTSSDVMLSVAGVQRSGTPAESKHPYQSNCRGQGFLAPLGMTAGLEAMALDRMNF